MKKILSLYFLVCTGAIAKAQTPFATMDSVDINHLHATALVHGDMWDNAGIPTPRCYSTNDSMEMSGGGSIWISGYDASGQLHIAAGVYRDSGIDYWPGPLDASGNLSYATSQNWAKIWKVNRTDIQIFQALSAHSIANTPEAILTWPAKGNTYAIGNGGAVLSITNDMAPFVDLNGNGIYEPLLGEYPDIKGDQALWWVFSDNGPTHNTTNGRPLDVEIHAMAYGYNRGTLIDNVVYYEYTLINKSSNTYSNFRLAQMNVAQVGYYLDNYIGYDSLWRMGITYKATNDPGGGVPVNHIPGSPNSAVTMIVLPGDASASYVAPGSFTYFTYEASFPTGYPTSDAEYDNYMRAKIKNGTHITNDFVARGTPSTGYGAGPDCNYVFAGDPGDTAQWSECTCNNGPSVKYSVLSSNDFSLVPGSPQKIVMALIATNLRGIGGCPIANFDSIKVVADTAWSIYYNPPPPRPLAVANVATGNTVNIYPNPANDKLYIENAGNNMGEVTITIYNMMGQVVNTQENNNGQKFEADISRLPAGLYNVLYNSGNTQTTKKFVKD